MLPTALSVLALLGFEADPPPRGADPDPPVQVWLSRDRAEPGDRIKVRVRTIEDGFLLVVHADPDGRLRVLFPLDPTDDDFVRGGEKYELRSRGDREALNVYHEDGSGTVLAAYSQDPFQFESYTRNGHWDYRALAEHRVQEDPELELLELVDALLPGGRYEYDLATYYIAEPHAYSSSLYYGGHYRRPVFGLHIGFGHHYYRPYYYGYRPFYYDPFYYDPFFYGFGSYYYNPYPYGFGYGFGYRRGRTVFFTPGGFGKYSPKGSTYAYQPGKVEYRRRALSTPGAGRGGQFVSRGGGRRAVGANANRPVSGRDVTRAPVSRRRAAQPADRPDRTDRTVFSRPSDRRRTAGSDAPRVQPEPRGASPSRRNDVRFDRSRRAPRNPGAESAPSRRATSSSSRFGSGYDRSARPSSRTSGAQPVRPSVERGGRRSGGDRPSARIKSGSSSSRSSARPTRSAPRPRVSRGSNRSAPPAARPSGGNRSGARPAPARRGGSRPSASRGGSRRRP